MPSTVTAPTANSTLSICPMGINQNAAGFLTRRIQTSHDDTLIVVREITQNAIDAGATEITWTWVDVDGARKLCCVDNGSGFDPAAMKDQLNLLYSSGHQQGVGQNHGIGGKTSSLGFSPVGVEYVTKPAATPDTYYQATLVRGASHDGIVQDADGNAVFEVTRRAAPSELNKFAH